MEQEKRKAKRINVDVRIKLKSILQEDASNEPEYVEVDVVDISTEGMAFKTDYQFKLGTYYDTTITLDNKETIKTIIEIIRGESKDDIIRYGCCFVGITQEEQFRISVYQAVAEGK